LSWVAVARNVGLAVLAAAALGTDRPIRPTPPDLVVVLAPVALSVGALHLARRRGAPPAAPASGPGAPTR
jgi:hypothetical protein